MLTHSPFSDASKPNKLKRVAYVSKVEDTGKNEVYLRLSSSLVKNHVTDVTDELKVEVQFQLNRIPSCEMHAAVDGLQDLDLVLPDVGERLAIPWTPGKQWASESDAAAAVGAAKLNPKQKEAILAITAPLTLRLPPILIIGPYGTGKTFTIGQAIKILLKQTDSKVLVCTHSNSAADLYIREYLHPFIEKNPSVRLVRVYYKHRWVQTVHQTVQRYCLIHQTEGGDAVRKFRNPTLEDVFDSDIVVATLSTSRYLSCLGLPPNHFTHILIDEAAQAMECEALTPLGLIAAPKAADGSGRYTILYLVWLAGLSWSG